MKTSIGIILALMTALLLGGCEGEGKYQNYVYPEPVVESIYPTEGYVADYVAIQGHDFGDRMEPVKVWFGGVEAEITSCSNRCIVVRVPEKAVSGAVDVQVWQSKKENVATFTVIPTPKITSIQSENENGAAFAVGGDKVHVLGESFGFDPAKVQVTINGKEAQVNTVSDSEIVFTVPAGYGSGKVMIDVNGYQLEGSSLIDPSTTGDVTHLFLTNYCRPFMRSDESDGEWGTAAGWIKNANFPNNTFQINDEFSEGVLTMVGSNSRWNGALYQVTVLPKGEYEVSVDIAATSTFGGRYGCKFAIAKGDSGFPELTGGWSFVENDIVLCEIDMARGAQGSVISGEFSTTMTVDDTYTVSIGFATMLAANNYVKINGITIIKK